MPLKKTNTKREPAKTNNRFGKTKKGIRNKRRLNRTNSPGNANRKSAGPSEIAAGQNKKGESTRKASKRAGLFCDFHTNDNHVNPPNSKISENSDDAFCEKFTILRISSTCDNSIGKESKICKENSLLDELCHATGSSDESIASSSSEGLTSISEAKTCSFIVIGSNPGEPKKIFKDEKSDDNSEINIGKSIPCEGQDLSPFNSILKKKSSELIERDGGDIGIRSFFDETVPYCYQAYPSKKKQTKKVNFRPQVDIIQYAGGEGCRVISRVTEPLKNERVQQARNTELRKGYLMLKFQRVETWHKNIKFIK